MASNNLGPVQPQRVDTGLSSRMIFQDDAVRFARTGGDHAVVARKPSASSGFVVDGDRSRFDQYRSQNRSWNLDARSHSEGSDDEDDGDEEEDDDLDEGDGLVSLEENHNVKNGNNSSGSVQSSSQKVNGPSRGLMEKDGSLRDQQHERARNYENAITVVEPELYCAQILNGGDGSGSVQKEMGGENGNGFRKESGEPGESLRMHLLDPITGVLMDDAMILPCGHSFGSGGMHQVFRMKACCKCSQPISEGLIRANLALRSAVQAFRREEESQSLRSFKRRRDRYEQDKCNYDDQYPMDARGKGVQFPFVVSDRVIIKGNKRTPQRFVGRVAVVTMQCLNGWYVVKTLDNAESVKLQYRSLAKYTDESPSNTVQNKSVTPNWL